MSDEVETVELCARGCMVRGMHYAECPSFGESTDETCRGCVPARARKNMVVCNSCYYTIRHLIDVAPDVVSLIRSQADPLKAFVYDQEIVSGGRGNETPAPVAADLIDAADDVISVLAKWSATEFTGLEPGSDGLAAHDQARWRADEVLTRLEWMLGASWVNQVPSLFADVADIPTPVVAESPWTIARAAARWPIEERAFWAAQACPGCRRRSVRVSPPRTPGGDIRYRCTGCGWERHDFDDDGFWVFVFSRKSGVDA